MQVQTNKSFGPPFVIVDGRGREIASAHKQHDATAFASGLIDRPELDRRNDAVEANQRCVHAAGT